jgi:hypothetical protein
MFFKRSYCSQRYKARYAARKKEYYIYILHIPSQCVSKIGRTSRLSFRIKNLLAAVWMPYELWTVHCGDDPRESLLLDRFLLAQFSTKQVVREWFKVSPFEVRQAMNTFPFTHLEMKCETSQLPPDPPAASSAATTQHTQESYQIHF